MRRLNQTHHWAAASAFVASALLTASSCTVAQDEPEGPNVGQIEHVDGYEEAELLTMGHPVLEDSTVSYVDAANLCLYTNRAPDNAFEVGGNQAIQEGDRLVARVAAPDCLSTSCDVDRVARCWTQTVGNVITFHSVLSYRPIQASLCTMDCGTLAATCETPTLRAGDYVLVHGAERTPFTVPSTFSPCQGVVEDNTCESTAECGKGHYCDATDDGPKVCKAYKLEGERCGSLDTHADLGVCSPGLTCNRTTIFADLPGMCVAFCAFDDDCESGVCGWGPPSEPNDLKFCVPPQSMTNPAG